MEKKSESICTRVFSLIKKIFGYYHCFEKRKSVNLSISEESVYLLSSKNIVSALSPSQTKTNIDSLPAFPINIVASYLDVKSLLALSFVNKNVHSKLPNFTTDANFWKEKFLGEEYNKNLLKCYVAVILHCHNSPDYIKYCIDYKTGANFDICEKVIIRTINDFADRFIKTKVEIKSETKKFFYNIISSLSKGVANKNIIVVWFSYVSTFMYMFTAGGFTIKDFQEIQKKLVDFDSNQKQIKNYEKVTGKSYKSIYDYLKNNPKPEKPERGDYIKAYEELKKEKGSCNIF